MKSGRTGDEARWDERVRVMATLIPRRARVLDVGAGRETLRGLLPKGATYTPADTTKPEGGVLLDFNTGAWPRGSWDVAFVSGALEYAVDPGTVLVRLGERARFLVLSYDHGGTLSVRRRKEFENHLSRAGLEDLMARTGWRFQAHHAWRGQTIYRAEKT